MVRASRRSCSGLLWDGGVCRRIQERVRFAFVSVWCEAYSRGLRQEDVCRYCARSISATVRCDDLIDALCLIIQSLPYTM